MHSVFIFPIVGAFTIAIGVLMAVFNDRSARIQKWFEENFTLLGRWTSTAITPGFTRVFGIVVAGFGVLYLTLSLVTLFASLSS